MYLVRSDVVRSDLFDGEIINRQIKIENSDSNIELVRKIKHDDLKLCYKTTH